MKLIERFGNPFNDQLGFEIKHMVKWDIPHDINLAIPALPNKMYTNKVMVVPLEKVFRRIIERGLQSEIKTYDGCFNVRKQRMSSAISWHAYGLAIDLNAAWNPLKIVGKLDRDALRKTYCKWSEEFLSCWVEFDCGANWTTRIDAMHFQLKI